MEAAWLEPPPDFGKPVWRDVLEALNLGPEERDGCRTLLSPEARATLRLWGRVAAKDIGGLEPSFPREIQLCSSLGDHLIDTSVRAQLNALRQSMAGN